MCFGTKHIHHLAQWIRQILQTSVRTLNATDWQRQSQVKRQHILIPHSFTHLAYNRQCSKLHHFTRSLFAPKLFTHGQSFESSYSASDDLVTPFVVSAPDLLSGLHAGPCALEALCFSLCLVSSFSSFRSQSQQYFLRETAVATSQRLAPTAEALMLTRTSSWEQVSQESCQTLYFFFHKAIDTKKAEIKPGLGCQLLQRLSESGSWGLHK